MPPLVAVRCVTKSYGRGATLIKALDNVSLEARLGELIHLIGPSGAGKTTLLNLISALDRPDTGEILISGVNVAGFFLSKRVKYLHKHVRGNFLYYYYLLLLL